MTLWKMIFVGLVGFALSAAIAVFLSPSNRFFVRTADTEPAMVEPSQAPQRACLGGVSYWLFRNPPHGLAMAPAFRPDGTLVLCGRTEVEKP